MKLFASYTIAGKLELSNRIVMPPLVTRLASDEGQTTRELVDRYVLYALWFHLGDSRVYRCRNSNLVTQDHFLYYSKM